MTETLHIIHDGDEPDEILTVPEGMSKIDYGFAKILGGQRQMSRKLSDTHGIAVKAHGIASGVRTDFDARTVRLETVRTVAKVGAATVVVLGGITTLLSYLMGWLG